jgi:hypothetical protein
MQASRFMFDGVCVSTTDNPGSLGMEDGDVLDVFHGMLAGR